MATERYLVCTPCRSREWVTRLFDVLHSIEQGKTQCPACGVKKHLELKFEFGGGKWPYRCKVLDVFLPKPRVTSWREGKSRVAFYPFLVIVKSLDDHHEYTWFPYWHIERNGWGDIRRVK
jgi:hypothetical protein